MRSRAGFSKDRPLELARDLGVAPECELGFDTLLETREPLFLEPCYFCRSPGRVREVRERRAAE